MTVVWAGLSVGAVYALVAVGFNIVFVATSTFNFAQAQFIMIGTLLAYTAAVSLHLPVVVTIVGGAVLGALIGVLQYLLVIRPVMGRGVHGELVTTVGAAVVVEGLAIQFWGPEPARAPAFVSGEVVTVLGGRVTVDELVLLGVAVVLILGVAALSRGTIVGLAGSAASEDREAASLRGIDVSRVAAVAVALAAALAVAVGPIVATKTQAFAGLGTVLVLKAFLVLAIGGFGSYAGLLIGGLVVGLVEALVGTQIGSQYTTLVLFLLLLAVLLVRPQGIFGRVLERAV